MLFQNNRRLTVVSYCTKLSKRPLKAKKNIAGIHNMQQTKQHEINVIKKNILAAHSSEKSAFTDDSLNS
jgi:hypothetical protein